MPLVWRVSPSGLERCRVAGTSVTSWQGRCGDRQGGTHNKSLRGHGRWSPVPAHGLAREYLGRRRACRVRLGNRGRVGASGVGVGGGGHRSGGRRAVTEVPGIGGDGAEGDGRGRGIKPGLLACLGWSNREIGNGGLVWCYGFCTCSEGADRDGSVDGIGGRVNRGDAVAQATDVGGGSVGSDGDVIWRSDRYRGSGGIGSRGNRGDGVVIPIGNIGGSPIGGDGDGS